jgi:hypothetical protein
MHIPRRSILAALVFVAACGDTAVEVSPDAGASSTIGAAVGPVTKVVVTINLADGFTGWYANTVYTVEGSLPTVRIDDGSVDAGSSTTYPATAAQIQAVFNVVASTPWHAQPSCIGVAIDGAPYPPKVAVFSAAGSRTFGVSGAECAHTDHSALGDVITCAQYDAIMGAIAAITGVAPAGGCAYY